MTTATKPKIETRNYTLNGCKVVEEMCPDMWCIVDIYHPSPSVTPWDYYGGKHQREILKVLELAGIPAVGLTTTRKKLNPVGTGPGGSVRLGDAMMPGVYKVAVHKYDTVKAENAIQVHKNDIKAWLENNAPMPPAIA